jgi:hypothetical protein
LRCFHLGRQCSYLISEPSQICLLRIQARRYRMQGVERRPFEGLKIRTTHRLFRSRSNG